MPEISKTPGPDPISKRLTQLRKQAGFGGPFAQELKLAGQVERDLADADSSLIPIRIAILAAHTLDHFIKVLVTRLKLAGFTPEVFVSEFGVIAQSVFDQQSSLYTFNPDIIWIFTTHRDLKLKLDPMASIEMVEQMIEATIAEQKALVEQIQSNSSAAVILNNADLPVAQALGNYQSSVR